jgi:hypothetical protein
MAVVMPLELAQCVPQVGLVPDQRPVQEFGAQCLPASEFRLPAVRLPERGGE